MRLKSRMVSIHYRLILLLVLCALWLVYAQELAHEPADSGVEGVMDVNVHRDAGAFAYSQAMDLLSTIPATTYHSTPNAQPSFSHVDKPNDNLFLTHPLRFVRQVYDQLKAAIRVARQPSTRSDTFDKDTTITTHSTPHNATLDRALELLNNAAYQHDHADALYTLGNMYTYGHYGLPHNYTAAYHHYAKLADQTGNATAQHMLGFFHATGLASERDQGLALLYHSFAAMGNVIASQMTLGYRYMTGIGTPGKCEDAVYYYKQVADKVIEYYLSGPPGGRALPLPKVRLSDDDGGVYGAGASWGPRKSLSTTDGDGASLEDVLEYYRYMAKRRGEYSAQLILGQLYYQGTRSVPQNFKLAYDYLKLVVEQYFPLASTNPIAPEPHGQPLATNPGLNNGRGPPPTGTAAHAAGLAASLLGKMYLRGEYVPQDNRTAWEWFLRGAELSNPSGLHGVGMMYRDGIFVPQDIEKASEYFKEAADQDYDEAQVSLGRILMSTEARLPGALQYFKSAASPPKRNLLAYYYLAEMHRLGIATPVSCQVAVNYYKLVAEKGDWLDPVMETAYNAYRAGDEENALLHYIMAAERGYEVAQSNVAWLLDTNKHLLELPAIFGQPPPRDPRREELAFIYWSRASNQENLDARMKVGDYYYWGIGVNKSAEKAASVYRIISDLKYSSMAMWNLGWMHENGMGVAKDLHLAKRFYDQAVESNPDAYLPVMLSLVNLHVKIFWTWLTGGDGLHGNDKTRSQQYSELDEPKRWLYFAERSDVGNAVPQTEDLDEHAHPRRPNTESPDWDIGREGEHITKKYTKDRRQRMLEAGEDFDEDDFIREAANGAQGLGPDGYPDNSRRLRDEDLSDEEYDELVEDVVILTLFAVIAGLVYIRQNRLRQQAQEPQAQGANNQNQGIIGALQEGWGVIRRFFG
ncbi:hypothetical protein BZG36_00530 [Bifiguratus adelaidae]|uniref:Uncharacterized protein n=1 Tax=Bifiguratus adelaidae TaxID=1938954 RepID=A0A261Y7B1_9FUNG|nr:hypothetical protein BZG36_00530 [Bifiguratus adelaidae]